MAALNVRTCVEGSKMNITWDLEGDDIQAVCIQIAADPEFTSFLNMFVLPKVYLLRQV